MRDRGTDPDYPEDTPDRRSRESYERIIIEGLRKGGYQEGGVATKWILAYMGGLALLVTAATASTIIVNTNNTTAISMKLDQYILASTQRMESHERELTELRHELRHGP